MIETFVLHTDSDAGPAGDLCHSLGAGKALPLPLRDAASADLQFGRQIVVAPMWTAAAAADPASAAAIAALGVRAQGQVIALVDPNAGVLPASLKGVGVVRMSGDSGADARALTSMAATRRARSRAAPVARAAPRGAVGAPVFSAVGGLLAVASVVGFGAQAGEDLAPLAAEGGKAFTRALNALAPSAEAVEYAPQARFTPVHRVSPRLPELPAVAGPSDLAALSARLDQTAAAMAQVRASTDEAVAAMQRINVDAAVSVDFAEPTWAVAAVTPAAAPDVAAASALAAAPDAAPAMAQGVAEFAPAPVAAPLTVVAAADGLRGAAVGP